MGIELGAALPAHRSALEFERQYAAPQQVESVSRELFAIRVALARLSTALKDPAESGPALAALAIAEAEDLEKEAQELEPFLGSDAAGRRVGLLRLVCGFLRVARFDEGRAWMYLSSGSQGRRMPGYEEALELEGANERLQLALKHFLVLVEEGHPWTAHDADWLRLRAGSTPARMRARAVWLRCGAEATGAYPLLPSLEAWRTPYIDHGFEPCAGLAWVVAGFNLQQALSWGVAGVLRPEEVLAWQRLGLNAEEAKPWAQAGHSADDHAVFKACGVPDPEMASELRTIVGDVEHLRAWHGAGFSGPDILHLHAVGVKDIKTALDRRKAGFQAPISAKPAAGPVDISVPSEGGAWLGWGAYDFQADKVSDGTNTALGMHLERGNMLAVPISESVVLPGRTFEPPNLVPVPKWQDALDQLRSAGGMEPVRGQWYIYAWAGMRAWLYWGLAFRSLMVPWGEAIDFDSTESWMQRWERRSREWGEDGAVCPCRVGRVPGGGWWIGVKGSVMGTAVGQEPMAVDPAAMTPEWTGQLKDFCLRMGMPVRAGQWHLLAGKAADPE